MQDLPLCIASSLIYRIREAQKIQEILPAVVDAEGASVSTETKSNIYY